MGAGGQRSGREARVTTAPARHYGGRRRETPRRSDPIGAGEIARLTNAGDTGRPRTVRTAARQAPDDADALVMVAACDEDTLWHEALGF